MSTWDDKPNDYEHALAQIKRLDWALEQFKNNQDVIIAAVREATVEECERVAAAAIRALKNANER